MRCLSQWSQTRLQQVQATKLWDGSKGESRIISRDVSSAARVLPSVSTGNYYEDVCQPPTSKTTNAQGAENPVTVPNFALTERETKLITTYKHAASSTEFS